MVTRHQTPSGHSAMCPGQPTNAGANLRGEDSGGPHYQRKGLTRILMASFLYAGALVGRFLAPSLLEGAEAGGFFPSNHFFD